MTSADPARFRYDDAADICIDEPRLRHICDVPVLATLQENRLSQLMTNLPSDDDPPPVPPVRPERDECCHGGCEPCVFDLYDEALERYEKELRAWQQRRARVKPGSS